MNKFLTIKNGLEDGVDLMVDIKPGMEKELNDTLSHLKSNKQPIEITYGEINDIEYRDNQIKSVMFGECCTFDEAVCIVDENK